VLSPWGVSLTTTVESEEEQHTKLDDPAKLDGILSPSNALGSHLQFTLSHTKWSP